MIVRPVRDLKRWVLSIVVSMLGLLVALYVPWLGVVLIVFGVSLNQDVRKYLSRKSRCLL